MLVPVLALLSLLQQPQATPPAVARVVITPANPTVVAGDSIRLHAQALDAQGQPISGVRIMFGATNMMSFEGSVDTSGVVHAGAVGNIPVTAVALVPGSKPVTQRVDVRMVPGPAARISGTPASVKLL